jgi:hypothetical protein
MMPILQRHVLIWEFRSLAHWTNAAGVVLLVAVLSVLLPADWARADDAAPAGQASDEMGIKVAAWAVTVPYIIAKGAFALGGAIVGGLGYVFSGLSYNTANAVWAPSMSGTYIIRPAHLRGEEAIRFVGEESGSQEAPPPAAEQSPAEK